MPLTRVDLSQDVYAKMLFYGQPGSWKTRLSASAALDDRTWPALMVSMVGNPLSIRDYARQPDVVEITSIKDLNFVYSFFSKGQPKAGTLWEILGKPDTEKNPYKCLIFDGATNLQRKAMADAIGAADLAPGEIPTQPQMQHHGQVLARMLNIADHFFALPNLHFIMTALEYEQFDANQQPYYRVQFTGQAAQEIPSYAMLVGRLVARERAASAQAMGAQTAQTFKGILEKETNAEAVLLLRTGQRYYAKNQYCKGPAYMINPTMTKLLDLIGVPGEAGNLVMEDVG